jgi:hypothetical protein
LEENALQNCIRHFTDEKIHPYMAVLKLYLLADLQQKAHEIVLSVISCPTIIILENTLN